MENRIACMCFSKDRPLQLEAYLETLTKNSSGTIKITVLYKSGNERYENAYRSVMALFPYVEFIPEKNFRRIVTKWLESNTADLILFGVDDWIYRRPFDTSLICKAFDENPDLLGFSLRLGMEITHSGMYGLSSMRPNFISEEPFLLWKWKGARNEHLDWIYPFEICGTVYRREYVLKIISILDSCGIEHPHWKGMLSSNWGHPSKFEALSCYAVRTCTDAPPLMASFREAKGNLITVNRVQEECDNFIYDGGKEMTPDELLKYYENGYKADTRIYENKFYPAIMSGDFSLVNRNDPSDSPVNFITEPHKIILSDFFSRMQRELPSVISTDGFKEFINDYLNYFSMPLAEHHAVRIVPPFFKETSISEYIAAQNEWALSRVSAIKPESIIDFGSDGKLVSALSGICTVKSCGSLHGDMPFEDNSVTFLSSFSYIETIGLGSCGEGLDPLGSIKALREIKRVIRPGGTFIGSFSTGRDSFLEFNRRRGMARDAILKNLEGFEILSEAFLYPESGKQEDVRNMYDFSRCLWCVEMKKSNPPPQ